MIVWINGTFEAGKSNIARELAPLLPRARVYDPETVGDLLRHVLTEPVDDFQDWPPWRQLVVETAAEVHRYVGGILVTPMTVLRRDYLQEIFDSPAHAARDIARRLGVSAGWRAPGASQGPPRRR